VTVGKRGVESGELELQVRRGRERSSVGLDGAAQALEERWRALP
jgi:prolyl-tRNA synthetase